MGRCRIYGKFRIYDLDIYNMLEVDAATSSDANTLLSVKSNFAMV